MAVIDWRIFLLPYEQAVDEIKVKFKSIRTELRTKNEYSPIEFITGRVKQISSIIEKANKFDIPAFIKSKICVTNPQQLFTIHCSLLVKLSPDSTSPYKLASLLLLYAVSSPQMLRQFPAFPFGR